MYLAITRNAEGRVRFTELNPITAALLEAISNNDSSASGEALLRQLAGQIQYPDVDAFVSHGEKAFDELTAAEIIIGTRRTD